uniref:DUF3943 domain-containing protein n=1 Tax=Steinernema glaseri TaxID=37863 RepID=A0A1I7Z5Z5_9BILA
MEKSYRVSRFARVASLNELIWSFIGLDYGLTSNLSEVPRPDRGDSVCNLGHFFGAFLTNVFFTPEKEYLQYLPWFLLGCLLSTEQFRDREEFHVTSLSQRTISISKALYTRTILLSIASVMHRIIT